MSEKKLYQNFKKEWLKYKNSYCSRVETKFEDGRPDLHVVNQNRVDFFIELKYLKIKFKNKKLPIRNSQFHWFYRYNGQICSFFLFQIDKEYYVLSQKKLKEKIKEFSRAMTFEYFCDNCDKPESLKNIIKSLQKIE